MDRQSVLAILGTKRIPLRIISEEQTAQDIIHAVLEKHQVEKGQYDKVAYLFSGGTLTDVCERIYDFCRKNIKYNEESEEDQRVSAPSTILQRGWSDCKGYALFCGGILDALNRAGARIDWCFRFVCYQVLCKTPTHVFVVVHDGDQEIWLDPVVNSFDYHKPFWSGTDEYTDDMQKVGRLDNCGCGDTIGAGTTTAAGSLLLSATPALLALPGAGPFIAAAAGVAGLFLKVFGSSYQTSTGVRWLTQKYQYYVLGQNNVTSDNLVNEQYTDPSHKWFFATFGVPIYDKFRYHTLTGTDPNTGYRLQPFPSEQQRADAYLNYYETKGVVSAADALAAARIGTTWPIERTPVGPGAWKNIPIAPNVQAEIAAQQGGTTSQAASLLPAGLHSIPLWVWIVGAGLLLILLTQNKKA